MGYQTDFYGAFDVTPEMKEKDAQELIDFSEQRHDDLAGDAAKCPGVWNQWVPDESRKYIEWDGGEKFYEYVEWIKYLIDHFLAPWGIVVNGSVEWRGEDWGDTGTISVEDNEVSTSSP